MPGHVAKQEGPDPDPMPWLAVSEELSIKLKSKPYDAKKSCWVPNKATGGFDEGMIVEKDGEKVTVELVESKEVSLIFRNSKIHHISSNFQRFAVEIFSYFFLAKSVQEGYDWSSQPTQVRLLC